MKFAVRTDPTPEGIDYTPVQDYTNFDAEYAMVGDDIIVHLFHPHDRKLPYAIWRGKLPQILSDFAEKFWEATRPRLVAAYTHEEQSAWCPSEIDSYWFKACGFANQGDPEARVLKFLEGLDEALDAVM